MDNKWQICGSANANERSMGGKTGDTELAIISTPEPGYEDACKTQIMHQREQTYRATLGGAFVEQHPECIEHPELFANERRELALNNLECFMENSVSQEETGASKLLTWPWKYDEEVGHVGEYTEGSEHLIDTPDGQEDRDYYRWHPEKKSKELDALAFIGLRLAN